MGSWLCLCPSRPKHKHKVSAKKTLILGNFGRGVIGEDAYRACLHKIFDGASFAHPFDIIDVPRDMAEVVCVGGDVFTRWFVRRLARIMRGFKGHVYAFSVCVVEESVARAAIPYFDAVVMRSSADAKFAAGLIGTENVFCAPDAASILVHVARCQPGKHVGEARNSISQRRLIGLSPGAMRNADFRAAVVHSIKALQAEGCQVCLVPFKRSEYASCHEVARALEARVNVIKVTDPGEVLEHLKCVDVIVSTHLHPLVFGTMLGIPCVALACSSRTIDSIHPPSTLYAVHPMVNQRLEATFDPDELTNMVSVALDDARKRTCSGIGCMMQMDLARMRAVAQALKPRHNKRHFTAYCLTSDVASCLKNAGPVNDAPDSPTTV